MCDFVKENLRNNKNRVKEALTINSHALILLATQKETHMAFRYLEGTPDGQSKRFGVIILFYSPTGVDILVDTVPF